VAANESKVASLKKMHVLEQDETERIEDEKQSNLDLQTIMKTYMD